MNEIEIMEITLKVGIIQAEPLIIIHHALMDQDTVFDSFSNELVQATLYLLSAIDDSGILSRNELTDKNRRKLEAMLQALKVK
jgi:hypothetical protein